MTDRFSSEFWLQNRFSANMDTPHDWFPKLAETNIGAGECRFSQPLSETEESAAAKPSFSAFTEIDNEPECRTMPDGGTLFVPECYEARYPYPLIVWLGDVSRHWGPFSNFMIDLSRRNIFGFLPSWNHRDRIERLVSRRNSSSSSSQIGEILSDLHESIQEIRHDFHLHSERIFLVGSQESALAALTLFLQRPEWFGGAAALDGRYVPGSLSLTNLNALRGKRVLLACGCFPARPSSGSGETVNVGRLLHTAGLTVSTRVYNPNQEQRHAVLSEINEWLMDAVCAAV